MRENKNGEKNTDFRRYHRGQEGRGEPAAKRPALPGVRRDGLRGGGHGAPPPARDPDRTDGQGKNGGPDRAGALCLRDRRDPSPRGPGLGGNPGGLPADRTCPTAPGAQDRGRRRSRGKSGKCTFRRFPGRSGGLSGRGAGRHSRDHGQQGAGEAGAGSRGSLPDHCPCPAVGGEPGGLRARGADRPADRRHAGALRPGDELRPDPAHRGLLASDQGDRRGGGLSREAGGREGLRDRCGRDPQTRKRSGGGPGALPAGSCGGSLPVRGTGWNSGRRQRDQRRGCRRPAF